MKQLVLLAVVITTSLSSCEKEAETILTNTSLQNIQAHTSYTDIRTKYIDIALNHEYKKEEASLTRRTLKSVEEMSLSEKEKALFKINEVKQNTTSTRSALDDSEEIFYNQLNSSLINDLNSNPLVIEAMKNSDGTEDLNSMIIAFPGDSTISKLDLLKRYEDALGNMQASPETRCARVWLPKWGSKIPYFFTENCAESLKETALLAMKDWEEATNNNISFKEKKNSGWNRFVWYIGHYWCIRFDQVNTGNFAGRASLGCTPWSTCQIQHSHRRKKGTILHELGHVLGLIHEHQRKDRDKHIIINMDYVQPGTKHNFYKVGVSTSYGPFDFNSIMMYGTYAFSTDYYKPTLVNGRMENEHLYHRIITTLDGNDCKAQRDSLSTLDKEKIKHIYN